MIYIIIILLWIFIKMKLHQRKKIIQAAHKNKQNEAKKLT